MDLTEIKTLRGQLDWSSRLLFAPLSVRVRPVRIGELAGEWLLPEQGETPTVILYLHGGGYAIGSLATHRGLVGKLAEETGLAALHIDYRLAPEHPFPAALEDAVHAYQWLLAQNHQVILAGDSAGGGLCMALQLALRQLNLPMPLACVCFSPWVDLTFSGESAHIQADMDPIVRPQEVGPWGEAYAGTHDITHPMISPLFTTNFQGLAPLLIQASTTEVLTDDARRLAANIEQQGGKVQLELYPELLHVWQLFWRFIPEANEAIQAASHFIQDELAVLSLGSSPGQQRKSA
jgi:acetyl esterase/lipase